MTSILCPRLQAPCEENVCPGTMFCITDSVVKALPIEIILEERRQLDQRPCVTGEKNGIPADDLEERL